MSSQDYWDYKGKFLCIESPVFVGILNHSLLPMPRFTVVLGFLLLLLFPGWAIISYLRSFAHAVPSATYTLCFPSAPQQNVLAEMPPPP